MQANAGALSRHGMPALPGIPEAIRENLTRERMAEAGVIAATIAMIVILATALQLGLERYTIGWM